MLVRFESLFVPRAVSRDAPQGSEGQTGKEGNEGHARDVKSVCRSLIASRTTSLALYRAYATAESSLGNAEEAGRVLDTTLSKIASFPSEEQVCC